MIAVWVSFALTILMAGFALFGAITDHNGAFDLGGFLLVMCIPTTIGISVWQAHP